MVDRVILSDEINFVWTIKDTFIKFFMEFFYFIEEYKWLPDDRVSKIIIADEYSRNLSVVEGKPMVVFMRHPLVFGDLAMGQKKEEKLSADKIRYMDLIGSNATIGCYAGTGLEAEKIATYVALALVGYGNKVLGRRGINHIKGVTVGEEQPVEASSEYEVFNVPVTFNYGYALNWVLQIQTQQFNRINIELDSPTSNVLDQQRFFRLSDPPSGWTVDDQGRVYDQSAQPQGYILPDNSTVGPYGEVFDENGNIVGYLDGINPLYNAAINADCD
jgi:hypothetical protein